MKLIALPHAIVYKTCM